MSLKFRRDENDRSAGTGREASASTATERLIDLSEDHRSNVRISCAGGPADTHSDYALLDRQPGLPRCAGDASRIVLSGLGEVCGAVLVVLLSMCPGLEQLVVACGLDGSFAVTDTEFAIDGAAVRFDGAERYVELGSNVSLRHCRR